MRSLRAPLDGARHHCVDVLLAEAAVRVGQVVVAGQLQHGDLGRVALVQLPVLQAPQQVALVVACVAGWPTFSQCNRVALNPCTGAASGRAAEVESVQVACHRMAQGTHPQFGCCLRLLVLPESDGMRG